MNYLTTSGKDLMPSNQDIRSAFTEFLVHVDPHTHDKTAKQIFDIAVEFFRPMEMDMSKMPPQQQLMIVREIANSQEGPDFTMGQYIDKLEQSYTLVENMKKEIQEAKGTMTELSHQKDSVTHQSRSTLDLLQETSTIVTTSILDVDQKDEKKASIPSPIKIGPKETEKLAGVTFNFRVVEIENEQTGEKYFELQWQILDPMTGTQKNGSQKVSSAEDASTMKLSIKSDFFQERIQLLRKKQGNLMDELNALDTQKTNTNKQIEQTSKSERNAMSDKDWIEHCKHNYQSHLDKKSQNEEGQRKTNLLQMRENFQRSQSTDKDKNST